MKAKKTEQEQPKVEVPEEEPQEQKLETNGGNIIDKMKEHQGTIIHWAITAGVVAIIGALLILGLAVAPAHYNADMARIEQGITTMGSDVADNAQDIGDNADDIGDIQDSLSAIGIQYNGVSDNVTSQADDIDDLQGRMTTAEADITTLEGDTTTLAANITTMGSTLSDWGTVLTGHGANLTALGLLIGDNADVIADMGVNLVTLEANVTILQGNVTVLAGQCDDLAAVVDDQGDAIETLSDDLDSVEDELDGLTIPVMGYLTGTSGNYTLHAMATESGNYTANVHLVFASAAVNWTTTVNWAAATAQAYVAVDSTNTTIGCWWNIGTFELAADTWKDTNVLFGGLADTIVFAYVEIFPVLI